MGLVRTSISSMNPSPTTVTTRQRPFPPRAHAISPSCELWNGLSSYPKFFDENSTYIEDVMPRLGCPTRRAARGYKRAFDEIRQGRLFGGFTRAGRGQPVCLRGFAFPSEDGTD